ncbi:hypothetical protein VC83_09672 [Pseudogymnoascus destructans]|uniref:Uncharacterized protein n=1 Tax=Pseudogymnoascus destructans TaxID=655981 RepID=A0A2P6FGN4_9PEZI|nr:uncharacterized protein VC83_09672 [Pseudogymnoascus destructans]PQM43545.1 hypothetical protein VC83_09672 [Pseudogymnoascus destructans]
MEQWRKKGPLGKLHNIVVYIQRSPQRIASFKLMSNNLCLLRDNSTRWNSWYSMLQRALRVQHAIELFCIKFEENENDLLSQGDWQDLRNMACILKNFADATLATEGYASSIDLG